MQVANSSHIRIFFHFILNFNLPLADFILYTTAFIKTIAYVAFIYFFFCCDSGCVDIQRRYFFSALHPLVNGEFYGYLFSHSFSLSLFDCRQIV
jgi:hypothetical protein